MKLRTQISLLLFMFGLVPLLVAFVINVPMIFDRIEILYHKAHLQNLRAEFSDLDQHLARRHEMARLLAKLPEPGMLLADDAPGLQAARAGYVAWANQVLFDQLDITRIFFLDANGNTLFSLDRDHSTGFLVAGNDGPAAQGDAERRLHEAAQHLAPGAVMNGPIVFDRVSGKTTPNLFMQMGLVSPVLLQSLSAEDSDTTQAHGSVILYLDMGGLAHAYRGNYWVLDNGQYLDSYTGESREISAFDDFQGLESVFGKGELALWKFGNQQVLWVPLFKTEGEGPLWVGRSVDASPLTTLRQKVELIVAAIVIGLLMVVFVVARLIAVRTERFGHELTDGISQVLENNEAVAFSWSRPQELNELGQNLTRLAQTHTEHSQALRAYADELEASNRYKSEFLANVSHELRTPLNSILLLSKMLSDSSNLAVPAEERRQAGVIYSAGSDLKALIDNILDLSRIEARQMSLVSETVDLKALLENAIELMRPQFDARGLGLALVLDPSASTAIVSDGEKLRQILLNFLSNAVKFSERGSTTVRLLSATDFSGIHYPVCISVQDSGIGIDSDKHRLVFDAFRQADGSTSRRFGGTGLGLSISRELARLVGGDIGLDSQPGEGSTFSLYLPLEMSAALTPADLPPDTVPTGPAKDIAESGPLADYGGVRVLLVDDDVRSLLALMPLLEQWKLDVMAAGDGNEALETLQTDGAFGLVIMDIMMPGIDGYEVTRQIRALPAFCDIPVIALTDSASEDTRFRCHDAGANDCVDKPVDAVLLRDVLDKYLVNTVARESGGGKVG